MKSKKAEEYLNRCYKPGNTNMKEKRYSREMCNKAVEIAEQELGGVHSSASFEEQEPIDMYGVRIFLPNLILDLGVGYISFARDTYETAIVLKGADGVGVMFLILDGDKRDEVKRVIEEYSNEKWLRDGLFGEIVAWACKHPDLNIEKSTIGRWHSRCNFKVT